MASAPLEPPLARTPLAGILRERAIALPNLRACSFLDSEGNEAEVLEIGELDRRARCIAAALQRLAARGRRALLLHPPGLGFVAAYLGCLYAGTIAVPVDAASPKRPSNRLLGIAEDSGATMVLALADDLEAWRERIPLPGADWIATDALDPNLADSWRDPEVEDREIASLQYTSGSLGNPKGVMLSHGNLVHGLEAIRKRFDQSSESSVVSWLPHYHDMGLVGGILNPLYVGFPTVLMSPMSFMKRPILWLEAITRFRTTISGAPNFAFEHCVRRIPAERRARLDLSSWRVAFNGAEPVRAATLDRFAEAFEPCGFQKEALYPCYGMAEATLLIAGGDTNRAPVVRTAAQERVTGSGRESTKRSIVSCGRAVDEHEVAIVDPQTRARQRDGDRGEVWFAGPSVACGYWNRPHETAETFGATLTDAPEVRFLRTGDLGIVLDGHLFITGRSKDVIVIAGVNHHLADIDTSVEDAHRWLSPGSCVSFETDGSEAEDLIVAVELDRQQWRHLRRQAGAGSKRPDGTEWSRREPSGRPRLTPSEAVALCDIEGAVRQALAREHGVRLHAFVPVPPLSLPRTTSGKVRRAACRRAFLESQWPTLSGPTGTRSSRSRVEA